VKRIGWDRGLGVAADARGLVGQAGAVLLRRLADRVGLTGELAKALPVSAARGWLDRSTVLQEGGRSRDVQRDLGAPPARGLVRQHLVLVRIDGAGASRALLEHFEGLNTRRRRVYYTVGWAMRAAEETVNESWMLAANMAADLGTWLKLLGLHDQPDLARAEITTMRHRLYAIPAKLARHARRRTLHLAADWPWAAAFTLCWNRIGAITPLPT
jgi:hypothetical protein